MKCAKKVRKTIFLMVVTLLTMSLLLSSAFGDTNEDLTNEDLRPSYGDLNGDGKINSIDLVLLRRYVLEIIDDFPVGNPFVYADLNGDGKVDSSDYILLRRYILNQIDSFPVSQELVQIEVLCIGQHATFASGHATLKLDPAPLNVTPEEDGSYNIFIGNQEYRTKYFTYPANTELNISISCTIFGSASFNVPASSIISEYPNNTTIIVKGGERISAQHYARFVRPAVRRKQLQVDTVTYNPLESDSVIVPITFTNVIHRDDPPSMGGIDNFEFVVEYDSNDLEAVEILPGSILPNIEDTNFSYEIRPEDNEISFKFKVNEADIYDLIRQDGDFASIKFNLKDPSSKEFYPISIKNEDEYFVWENNYCFYCKTYANEECKQCTEYYVVTIDGGITVE
ncbi:UNVERIFIED_CONTAM: dockerin type I repeat protein [Acetivibrio alkalicellulosi]